MILGSRVEEGLEVDVVVSSEAVAFDIDHSNSALLRLSMVVVMEE